MAPELLSFIDRKALITRTIAKNTTQATALSNQCAQKVTEYKQIMAEYEQKISVLKTEMLSETSRLTAENNELNNRLALIDLEDSKQLAARDGEGKKTSYISGGEKRKRRNEAD